MRPFLEVKVVKVKKEKECIGEICIGGERSPLYVVNNRIYYEGKEKPKSEGNWVNGENLDKIKFPCFCSFDDSGEKRYGEINKNLDDNINNEFIISDITKQTKGLSVKYGYPSLKEMMKERDVHILKGKIIIFEEE